RPQSDSAHSTGGWAEAGAFQTSGLVGDWPVPVTLNICTDGVAESVTVIAAARVPTALGVKVTTNVHCAFEASVAPHGVVPPGTGSLLHWLFRRATIVAGLPFNQSVGGHL